ncbi:MAG: hypothetical protein H0T08_06885 [Acidobacteria bacterium]|nr:hypothetical protein [Acidobacteriota bacterium]
MIRLKPVLETPPRECPNCHSTLTAAGFLIAGMRNLADFQCPQCKSEFYGDLPAGQGLYTPILLDKKSGAAYDDYNVGWFSGWLVDSYKQRTDEPLGFEVRKFSEVKDKVVLLNCLDILYGHSLLKLLNAQHYTDYQSDVSLIVMLPPFLEWMLPDGAAEAWVIDLPLRRGTEWNDWLVNEIGERLKSFPEVFLSVAFSHPHSSDFDIERFTRVSPFPLENFGHQKKPVITFIWREDRLWETEIRLSPTRFEKIKQHLGVSQERTGEQTRKIIKFAECLRGEFSSLDFAVVGIGKANNLPDWITDLRLTKLDATAERHWCERYAASHMVVGVHGSNMLLPSAHAGSVIELIGEDRWGNYLQDILFRVSDSREMFFRYRFVPTSTTPEELSRLALTLLRYEDFRRLMSPEFCRHREKYDLKEWQSVGRGNRD